MGAMSSRPPRGRKQPEEAQYWNAANGQVNFWTDPRSKCSDTPLSISTSGSRAPATTYSAVADT
jgi:hypothetical protein